MHSLSEQQLLLGLLALGVILLLARACGELARRADQPEVLGELFAGFVLGPSIFGAIAPTLYHRLFLEPVVSDILSGFSWVGVILLLLVAGLEVDLNILRLHARPGALAAAFAIVPSLIAGSLFAWFVLGAVPPKGVYLGIVLTVTGVSVVAKILLERGETRRGYAQVILAAGVASEVLVWLMVSVVSSLHASSPLLTGMKSALFAVGFFAFMMLIGSRLTYWAMRRVRDVTWITKGQLSLVLVLTFFAAAITQALGLHPLLGAFVLGVILARSPRANPELLNNLQSITLGIFGPVFFVLAGMRVDVLQLGSPLAIAEVALLLVVATAVKVGFSALGAKLGGIRPWESLLVGAGLNLKGGTDVVVAVIGTELGLLTARAYTMYTVVAILTVLFSPVLLRLLAAKAPPSKEEQERLKAEEASRRSYLPTIERVLVPVSSRIHSSLAASVVERIAESKHEHGQLLDITEYKVDRGEDVERELVTAQARDRLQSAGSLQKVQVTRRNVGVEDAMEKIMAASKDHDLIAIGSRPPESNGTLSFGELQDAVIHRAEADVLVAINHDADCFDCETVSRILVPTNGMEYSMAAGDVAGALAGACNAEIVLLHVVQPGDGQETSKPQDRSRMVQAASGVLKELAFRLNRLGVQVFQEVQIGNDPGDQIVKELERRPYDLLVMGGVDRGTAECPYLGKPISTVLTRKRETPAVLLIRKEQTDTDASGA